MARTRKLTGAVCLGAMLCAAAAVGLHAPRGLSAEDPPNDSAWSYSPVARPELPSVRAGSWVTNEIDMFVLAGLESEGLTPAAEADRRTLIRRATYDLTGLPPAPEEVAAFVRDDRTDAYERLVDRLLESPQYGVKWGRHWLDLVRWAETDSYERDRVKPGAWRYRDWVIDALNADMPYDHFVTHQLAGDELPDESLARHVATGYLHLGIRDDEPTDPVQAVYDDLDGMLDTTCRVMLAVSMGCARCHDHKKDPIPARDYYRMLAFFEGLKPYKVGGGNSVTTGNFVRSLPADLGTSDWDGQLEQWRRERAERLGEVSNLMREVRERWGDDAVELARGPLFQGQVLHQSFDDGAPVAGEATALGSGPGVRGDAATFGGDGRILIDRPVAEDFTIALWFRSDEPGIGNESDLRWFLGTGLVDAEVPGIVDDFGISLIGDYVTAGVGRPETFISGPSGAADGEWHHVAFTRHMESGRIALWFDGVEVASATGGTQPLTTPDEVSIGRMLTDRGGLVGAIDDVRFWDRPLSSREVLDLALDGGALPEHVALVSERLGEAEGERLEAALSRLEELKRPTREMVQVLSAQEVETPPPAFVRVRGMAAVKGDPVSPGFPQALGGGSPEIAEPDDGESAGRRLALARWITDPANPRTARVMANRLWQYHFGRGLVPSPSEFGELGEDPTHPELLDWLASELVAGDWRLKRMHRLMMLSSTYRMTSIASDATYERDPVNTHFSRFNPRRLTAEEIRDSMLAVNGTLNLEMGGPGVYPPMPEEVLATSSRPDAAWGRSSPEQAARRSVYIHAKRSLLSPMLESFDLADTDSSCPVRFTTTQPTQALTMLNSDFTNDQAAILAARLRADTDGSLEAMVIRGLRLVLLRQPESSEIAEGVSLVEELQDEDGLDEDDALSAFCLILINLNEFVYLD